MPHTAGLTPRPPVRHGDQFRPVSATTPLGPGLRLSTSAAWHLARRTAIAPTQALADQIAAKGTAAWVELQLAPGSIDDSACEAIVERHVPYATRRVSALRTDPRTKGHWWEGGPHLTEALIIRAVRTRRVLLESVVECLSDHVYVSAGGRGEMGSTDFDIDVLRKHALGRYADLLKAALRNVGLLHYLNNDVSSKDSLNENLGRELLELYTVGTGVYTQADVRDSARILTGHSIEWPGMTYRYDGWAHSTGPVKVMGFSHANATTADGPAVLDAYVDYLARHPRTAQRLCRRLAVRYVSDNPSAALVSELASVYLAADTDLRPVLRRLFAHPEFTASTGQKLKRPMEWTCAGLAARGKPYSTEVDMIADAYEHGYSFWMLESCGHAPRMWPDVNGYPDTAAAWMSTNGLVAAWHGSDALAGQWDERWGKTDWAARFGAVPGAAAWTVARRMAWELTGWTWHEKDLMPVAAFLASHGSKPVPIGARLDADARWNAVGAVRMVLASPYALLR